VECHSPLSAAALVLFSEHERNCPENLRFFLWHRVFQGGNRWLDGQPRAK
jgi:hypothetical protein